MAHGDPTAHSRTSENPTWVPAFAGMSGEIIRHARFAIRSFPRILFEHDLLGKPASTFPDHALARPRIARENERPEHLVFGVRGKGGGDAEPRHAAIEQIGGVRRGGAPA